MRLISHLICNSSSIVVKYKILAMSKAASGLPFPASGMSFPAMTTTAAQMLFDSNNTFPIVDVNDTDQVRKWYHEEDYDFSDSSEVLDCPVYSLEDGDLLDSVTFWVDGVVTCIMAFIGLIANIISAMILGK